MLQYLEGDKQTQYYSLRFSALIQFSRKRTFKFEGVRDLDLNAKASMTNFHIGPRV